MNKKLDEIKTRHAQRTPGPYMWNVNTKTKHAFLISKIGLRNIILDFWRWGTNSAGPAFRDFTGGILRRVEYFAVPRMAHHPNFDMYIDHPDAIGLEKSWEDVEYLLSLVNRLKIALEAVERQVKDPCNREKKSEGQQRRLMDYIWEEIVRPAVEEVRGSKNSEGGKIHKRIIICPNCSLQPIIFDWEIKEDILRCQFCGYKFPNPQKINKEAPTHEK